MAAVRGDNYRYFAAKILQSMHCPDLDRIFLIFSMQIVYNHQQKSLFKIFKKSNIAAIRGDNYRLF